MRMKNKLIKGWWILIKLDMVRKFEIWIILWVLEYICWVKFFKIGMWLNDKGK